MTSGAARLCCYCHPAEGAGEERGCYEIRSPPVSYPLNESLPRSRLLSRLSSVSRRTINHLGMYVNQLAVSLREDYRHPKHLLE
jgi:hypothetical protein